MRLSGCLSEKSVYLASITPVLCVSAAIFEADCQEKLFYNPRDGCLTCPLGAMRETRNPGCALRAVSPSSSQETFWLMPSGSLLFHQLSAGRWNPTGDIIRSGRKGSPGRLRAGAERPRAGNGISGGRSPPVSLPRSVFLRLPTGKPLSRGDRVIAASVGSRSIGLGGIGIFGATTSRTRTPRGMPHAWSPGSSGRLQAIT